jgi:ribosomal protein S6
MAKKNVEEQENDELEEVGSDPRVYELGFHLDPELPTEEVKKAYKKVRDLIAEKGSLVAECEPEKIQLAYTISRQETSGRRDFDSAYFSWIAYETTAENHSDMIVIRFIDLVTTKDAARHALEVLELSLKTSDRAKEPEEASGVELDAAIEQAVV